MPELFRLEKEEFSKEYNEKWWTYSVQCEFIFNEQLINYITITDYTWKNKKGREKISKEFQLEKQKLTFDHLIIKFAETNQKVRHEGKWYKLTSFVKEILHIPVVSGEIRAEEELKRIDEEYKDKLDDLRISPYGIALNWETTKLLMDDDERKYYEK